MACKKLCVMGALWNRLYETQQLSTTNTTFACPTEVEKVFRLLYFELTKLDR